MKRRSERPIQVLVTALLLITVGAAAGIGTAGAHASDDASFAVQEETDEQERNETVRAENLTDGGNATVVNLGENVTLDAVQDVSPQEPVVFVGPNATSGDNVTTADDGVRFNVSQEYVLGGEVAGWQGVAPESVEGTTNPTLNLTAGQLYAVTWVNLGGQPHNVVIEDQEGEVLARTDVVSGEGAAQTLVFRAPEGDGTYYCEVHPRSMRGNYSVTANATAGA